MKGALKTVFLVLLALGYPAAIYLGLTYGGLHLTGVGVALVATVLIAQRLTIRRGAPLQEPAGEAPRAVQPAKTELASEARRAPSAAATHLAGRMQGLFASIAAPLAALLLVGVASIVDDDRVLLALPVLINLSLFLGFGATLLRGRPMVETFARLLEGDLSPEKIRYCRSVTLVWTAFFFLNGLTAALLAVAAPLAWWAVYNGALSYGLIGLLFGVELLVRRARFGRVPAGWRVLLSRR